MVESLTGITDAMVAHAPTFAELAEDLYRRLAGKTLVAHNARFDFGFLRNEFRRVGLKYAPDVLCTVRLSRRLYPQERRHNLDSVIARHGLSCPNRHRALPDARVLWDFTQRLYRDLDAADIFNAVADQLKKPQLPAGLPADLPEQLPEAPGVYAFYAQNNVALHVGKSANLRARILSHFSGEALNALRKVADEHGLCHIGTGLQAGPGPCLGYQLKRCRGLCVGGESAIAHSMRMMQALHALRMRDWPHSGRIGIREHDMVTGRREVHVLDRWRHLGTAETDADLHEILQTRADTPFDASVYRILLQYFRSTPRDIEIVTLH
jgi:DNA polymerase-3 subunit epsilon